MIPADDPRAEMPEQPKTTQVPREDILQAQLKQLLDRVGEGFGKVDVLVVDVTRLTGTVELVSNDLGIVKDRVTILESERSKLSGGVRGLSTTDAEQAAQLAQERAAREAIAAEVADLKATQALQLAILARLDKVASNPTVKVLGGMLLTALVTWLASKGLVVK